LSLDDRDIAILNILETPKSYSELEKATSPLMSKTSMSRHLKFLEHIGKVTRIPTRARDGRSTVHYTLMKDVSGDSKVKEIFGRIDGLVSSLIKTKKELYDLILIRKQKA